MQLWYYCKWCFNCLCKIPLETSSIQGFRLHIHFCFKNLRWLYLPDMPSSEVECTGLWWARFQESEITHSRSTAQMCSSEILQGDWSQTASSSNMLPARHLQSTLRTVLQWDPVMHKGWHHLSSLWVEFPCSPTQICVTCFIPYLQLVETAATICISHAPFISPSLVHGHYYQIILFFNWKENLQITCQQLSLAGERALPAYILSCTPEIISHISLSWPSCSTPGNFFMVPLT